MTKMDLTLNSEASRTVQRARAALDKRARIVTVQNEVLNRLPIATEAEAAALKSVSTTEREWLVADDNERAALRRAADKAEAQLIEARRARARLEDVRDSFPLALAEADEEIVAAGEALSAVAGVLRRTVTAEFNMELQLFGSQLATLLRQGAALSAAGFSMDKLLETKIPNLLAFRPFVEGFTLVVDDEVSSLKQGWREDEEARTLNETYEPLRRTEAALGPRVRRINDAKAKAFAEENIRRRNATFDPGHVAKSSNPPKAPPPLDLSEPAPRRALGPSTGKSWTVREGGTPVPSIRDATIPMVNLEN